MLSVIIATDESERALVPTLAALVPGAMHGAIREVIVADTGSRDQTAQVADIAGCRLLVSGAALAARLREAAAAARSTWLMFLRPGIAPDLTWVAETLRFVEEAELSGQSDARAAVFSAAPAMERPGRVALALMATAFGRRPRPDQGLVIARRLYDSLGGHRDQVADCETDLLRRLGRRRIVTLRSGVVKVDT
jgi:glycosyltransferase involved in cell wall biosynthesis